MLGASLGGTAGCDKSLKCRDEMLGEGPGLCFSHVPATWSPPGEEMVNEGLGETGIGGRTDGVSPLSR